MAILQLFVASPSAMTQSTEINYFPLTELLIFTLAVIGSISIYIISDMGLWLLILFVIFSYIVTMGEATIIKCKDDILKIIPFNPLLPSPSINTKSIIKITSVQTLEHQPDIYFGGSFFLFTRRYEVEYFDAKGRKRKAYFTIINKNKEARILKTLQRLLREELP